ncbi:complement factor H-related protein 4-like [Rhynchonycteris naso]
MLFLTTVILTLCVFWAHGQGRTCGFPEIKHGNMYEENKYKQTFPVVLGKYFYYSCDHSYVSPSQSLWTRITCTEEGWSPTPQCLRQCFFPWVENGHSSSSGQTHQEGDTVQIVCGTGYSLPHNQSGITCMESGWSTPPTCGRNYAEKECGPPPLIDNGDITTFSLTAYAPGSSVEYQCQAYYDLQGSRKVTCRDGKWSEPPKCLDACVISEEMMRKHNIVLKWKYNKKFYSRTEDKIEFMCLSGYRPKSPGTIFRVPCLEGKVAYPTCVRRYYMGVIKRLLQVTILLTFCASWAHGQEVTCDPPRFANGGYTPDIVKYRLGQVITYHCKNGFHPSTRGNTAKCTEIGWEPPPRCSFKPCDYPEIKHGELYRADRYRPYFPATTGQWYYYSCHTNYETDSQGQWGVLTCTPKGWSPKVPCRRKCVFNYVQYGHSPKRERSYFQGQSVKIDCYAGYSLPNQQSTMTCTENGWDPPPKCFRVETCLKSDVIIENGFLAESEDIYPLHKETQYRCKQGYITEDGQMSGSITCQRGGWSAQPKCIKLCVMPVFDNATAIITGKPFRPNDTLDYQCLDGFENRDGKPSGSMVCGENGWSHLPTCFKSTDKCGPPPNINNGDITSLTLDVYLPSSRVEYQCQAYYELRGTKYVTCSQGEWSEPPRCEEPCVISEEDMNENNIQLKGKHDNTYFAKAGDVIEFTCKLGHSALTSVHSFLALCAKGEVELPRCV